MANKYSKVNMTKSNTNKSDNETSQSDSSKYEEKQKKLDRGARIMAIVVIVAMIVTTFLAAGVFILD